MKTRILALLGFSLILLTPAYAGHWNQSAHTHHRRGGAHVARPYPPNAPPPPPSGRIPGFNTCPTPVYNHQPRHGRWEYRTHNIWVPGRHVTRRLPCGRRVSTWVAGHYRQEGSWVWVS